MDDDLPPAILTRPYDASPEPPFVNHIRVQPVDHRDRGVAARLHAVQQAAYEQEAALLGFRDARDFPPMRRTIHDVQGCRERFVAAFDDDDDIERGTIVGAASVEPPVIASWSGEPLDVLVPGAVHIASLAVPPRHQRRGAGRALIASIIHAHGAGPITVSTEIRNIPALRLYDLLGFKELRQRTIKCRRGDGGDHPLRLTLLLRSPPNGS